MRRAQSINLPLSARSSIVNTAGLGATQSGTTDDAVLRWDAAATVVGLGLAQTTTAAAGTTIAITRPGLYVYELGFDCDSSATVISGVSLNQTASLGAAPAFATSGVIDVLTSTAPAATVIPVKITGLVQVTRTQAFAAGGAILRFLGTTAAGATPAGIVTASAYYRVTKVADLFS